MFRGVSIAMLDEMAGYLYTILDDKERQFDTLLRNLPGMVYRCLNDQRWTMSFLSIGCQQLTGYPPEALLDNQQVAYWDIIHPDDRDKVWRTVQQGLQGDGKFEIRYRIITANNLCKQVWERGSGVYDDDGNLLVLEGFISDGDPICQSAFVQSNTHITNALQHCIDAGDVQATLEQLIPALDKLTGNAPVSLWLKEHQQIKPVFKNNADVTPSNDTAQPLSTVLEEYLTKKTLAITDAKNTTLWPALQALSTVQQSHQDKANARFITQPLDENSLIQGLLLIEVNSEQLIETNLLKDTLNNISLQVVAAIKQRIAHNNSRSLSLFKHAVEQSTHGVVLLDSTGTIEYANQAFYSICGHRYSDLTNTPLLDLHQNSELNQPSHPFWQAIKNNEKWLGEIQNTDYDGIAYQAFLTINPVSYDSSKPEQRYCLIYEDITARIAIEKQIKKLSFYDAVTGLENRALFNNRLLNLMKPAPLQTVRLALFMIDFDNFKDINTTLGHKTGDVVLHGLAQRIMQEVAGAGHVARIGGDEFTILLSPYNDIADLDKLAKNLLTIISAPLSVLDNQVKVSASIGIALAPEDTQDSTSLLRFAEQAMYRAKAEGKQGYAFFTEQMNEEIHQRMEIENDLFTALQDQQFQLYYQPQIQLSNNKIIGFEALIRWLHPQKGLISPASFIPVAEQTGQITEIGYWALEQAMIDFKQFTERDKNYQQTRVAVNLSCRQFLDRNLVERIKALLNRHEFPGSKLELEITESTIIQEIGYTVSVLQQLKDLDIYIAIDDFGTGYSSLAYLKQLPLNILKLDRCFVQGLPDDSNDAQITAAVIAMAHNLGLGVVAEGIEKPQQTLFLHENGCDYVQGFFYAKPQPTLEVSVAIARYAIEQSQSLHQL